MTYLLRVVLPDRPGTLGAVASALGVEGADILSVDVVERHQGQAVDDLVVDLPSARPPDVLITAAESVRDVVVESVRPFFGPLDTARELELVESVAAAPEDGIALLVDAVPRIFRSAWALVVEASSGDVWSDGGTRVRRVAASSAAPETEAQTLPWLPLVKATVLDPAAGQSVPSAWTDLDTELAAAPLGRSDRALVVGRPGGPGFRPSELARLSHLAGIVATMTG
ncbi:ACT domain-containing protein [Actinomycetospora sp. NBRC 106378]|uniref:ACT domain-containing protein n=1 Tax=Actinomycetospora sp. NBRC 106378 TaxID=3032208 RepID=UPI0024A46C40|nr:ACT domain-containing protein [Actinomycetospora sp. NBRC 106378]GLZ55937.1 amino acid-binding protein [Actinomycetospora sp. NBRC 106378]